MSVDSAVSFQEPVDNKDTEKFHSPIQILAHVAQQIDEINAQKLRGENITDPDVLRQATERAEDAKNIRILIGGISGWGYLQGVTISFEAFQRLAEKYPELKQLAVKSEEFLAPSLSLRHLQEGKAVASDKIIPKDDGIDPSKPPENMGIDSGDDVLRTTYGLKPDPMNPILLTSAGREVIQVKLHRPDEVEKPRSAQSIHLLVQIGLSAEVPHQLPRVEVPSAVKSDAKEDMQPAEVASDPQAALLHQLEDLIAA